MSRGVRLLPARHRLQPLLRVRVRGPAAGVLHRGPRIQRGPPDLRLAQVITVLCKGGNEISEKGDFLPYLLLKSAHCTSDSILKNVL